MWQAASIGITFIGLAVIFRSRSHEQGLLLLVPISLIIVYFFDNKQLPSVYLIEINRVNFC